MMHDTTALEKMGGLGKIFKKTRWLFLIGALALAGIPPLAGFFSKDLILELQHLSGPSFLFYMGLGASLLTGVYMLRAYSLTFCGTPRSSSKELSQVKEAPAIMWGPVSILAFLSLIGGFLGFAFNSTPPLELLLKEIGISVIEKELSTGLHLSPIVLFAMLGAILAVTLTSFIYHHYSERLGSPILLLKNSFYVESFYQIAIVKPLQYLAAFMTEKIETHVITGSANSASNSVQKTANAFQLFQSGQVRSYIAWMITGAAILIIYFIIEGFHA
jgi:NADH-quinone oxidoreductase subunit L